MRYILTFLFGVLLSCESFKLLAWDSFNELEVFNTETATDEIVILDSSDSLYCKGGTGKVYFESFLTGSRSYNIKVLYDEVLLEEYFQVTSPFTLFTYYAWPPGKNYSIEVVSDNGYVSNSFNFFLGDLGSVSLKTKGGVFNGYNYVHSICEGSSIMIRAEGRGKQYYVNTAEMKYTWYHNGILVSSLDSFLVNQAGKYIVELGQGSCIVKDSFNIVYDTVINPLIYVFDDIPGCNGSSKMVQTSYFTEESSYRWYRNDEIIGEENSYSLSIGESGRYTLAVTDGNCVAESQGINVWFSESVTIDIEAKDRVTKLCQNNVTLIRVGLIHWGEEYKYQWQRNGMDILGANSVQYSPYLEGNYRLKYTEGVCTSYSKHVFVEASNSFQIPILKEKRRDLCGNRVYLDLEQSHFGSTKKLLRNNVVVQENFLSQLPIYESGTYRVIVGYGTPCEVSSNELVVDIEEPTTPTVIASHKNLCGNDDRVTLHIDTEKLSYAFSNQLIWKKDDVYLNQENTYLITTVPGIYQLEVSNNNCTRVSEPITITKSVPDLKILTEDNNLYCSNRAAKLSVSNFRGYHLSYGDGISWFKDGVQIPYEHSPLYFTNEPGNYHYTVNYGTNCMAVSPTTEVTVGVSSDVDVSLPENISSGSNAVLTVDNCEGQVKWYDPSEDGNLLFSGTSLQTTNIYNNTDYWVTCTIEYCESARVKVEVQVIGNTPCPESLNHAVGNAVSGIHKSNNHVESSIQVPSDLVYQAGKSIILKPGFKSGEVFEAKIGGCP